MKTAQGDEQTQGSSGVITMRISERTASDALEPTNLQASNASSHLVFVANAQSVVVFHATGAAAGSTSNLSSASTNRTYPHIFDESRSEGRALSHISRAQQDARLSLDAFDESDFEEVESRFAQIAVSLREAHDLALFNKSLASVCTFVRRSVCLAAGDEISRSALHALIGALAQLGEDPMLSLSQAADLVEELSSEGWAGDDPVVERLVTLWLEACRDEQRQGAPIGASP